MASNSINVTPSQILEHRSTRKRCGLVGCVTGRPKPELDFFGYKDVQIWFRDAAGHLNGDPKFNRRDPYCFCFDCRGAFDPEGVLDAELVNEGHERARQTYYTLINPPVVEAAALGSSPLPPTRTMTEHPEAYKMGVPRETFFPAPTRSMTAYPEPRGWGQHKMLASAGAPPPPPAPTPKSTPPFPPRIKIPPRADDGEIPFSLPAPRHRDIMNETRETRIKKDLFELLTNYRGEMILIMDSRRSACFFDDPKERDDFMKAVNKKENDLWDKIHAAELLISSLDD